MDKVRHLYEQEQWPAALISAELGVPAATIRRHLRSAGVTLRQRGHRIPMPMTEIEQSYRAGASIREIADAYGFSYGVVRNRLAERGALRPTGARRATPRPPRIVAADVDLDEVRRLYHGRHWPLSRVARHLKVPLSTLREQMAKAGMARRAAGRARATLPTADIVDLYTKKRRTVAQIAAEFGVSETTVSNRLEEAGVPRRDPTRPTPLPTDEVRRLYVDERWSMGRIASHLGVTPNIISRHLAAAGIPRRKRGPVPRPRHRPRGHGGPTSGPPP